MEERGRGHDGAGGGRWKLREKKGGWLGCGGEWGNGGGQRRRQQMRMARASWCGEEEGCV